MSDDFSPIRPRRVPLSHGAPERPAVTGRGASVITWGLGVFLALGLLGAVFFLVPAWLESRPAAPESAAPPAPIKISWIPSEFQSPAASPPPSIALSVEWEMIASASLARSVAGHSARPRNT